MQSYRDLITFMIAGAVAALVTVAVSATIILICNHYEQGDKNLESALMLEDPDFGASVFAVHRSVIYSPHKMTTLAKEYLGEVYQYDGRPNANINLMVKILTWEQYFFSEQEMIEPRPIK